MTFKWTKNISINHTLVGYAYIPSYTSSIRAWNYSGKCRFGWAVGKHVVVMLSQFNWNFNCLLELSLAIPIPKDANTYNTSLYWYQKVPISILIPITEVFWYQLKTIELSLCSLFKWRNCRISASGLRENNINVWLHCYVSLVLFYFSFRI